MKSSLRRILSFAPISERGQKAAETSNHAFKKKKNAILLLFFDSHIVQKTALATQR